MTLPYSRSSCPVCRSYGLCAADCSNAPWNHDRPRTHRLAYLLRQRRWLGSPHLDTRPIFFAEERNRRTPFDGRPRY